MQIENVLLLIFALVIVWNVFFYAITVIEITHFDLEFVIS